MNQIKKRSNYFQTCIQEFYATRIEVI